MKTVFVLLAGEYDDYKLISVYSTRKKAEYGAKSKGLHSFLIREFIVEK